MPHRRDRIGESMSQCARISPPQWEIRILPPRRTIRGRPAPSADFILNVLSSTTIESAQAITIAARSVRLREPRSALPSTAIALRSRHARVRGAAFTRAASHASIARPKPSPDDTERHPVERGGVRHADTQSAQRALDRVTGPLRDRRERVGAGRHRAHRQQQDHREPMPHTTFVARIGHRLRYLPAARAVRPPAPAPPPATGARGHRWARVTQHARQGSTITNGVRNPHDRPSRRACPATQNPTVCRNTIKQVSTASPDFASALTLKHAGDDLHSMFQGAGDNPPGRAESRLDRADCRTTVDLGRPPRRRRAGPASGCTSGW